MLSENSQTQKDKYCIILFLSDVVKVVKFTETEGRTDCRGGVTGKWGDYCLTGIEFEVSQAETVVVSDLQSENVEMGCSTAQGVYLMLLNCAQKCCTCV